jgi:glucose/arabinose dehydrogenase
MNTRAARWATTVVPLVFTVVSGSNAFGQAVCNGVAPVFNTNLTRVTVASGMTTGTSGPLFVTAPPGDVFRIFIVLQNGVIRQLQRGDAPSAHTVFMDIAARIGSAGNEQGLLGLAFSPNFATDGIFYVNYTRLDGDTIISRFRTLDGSPKTNGDPASETILLRIHQPESNHNGGWLGFGPDGYLYIAQGDGGGGGDVHGTCGNGQSLATLLGKILRIDPTGTLGTAPDCGLDAGPYTIPPGNPFADGPASGSCDEIWAYGLRNPWRDAFDTATGDLYVADVGENCWEEIDWAPAGSTGGQNYGWRQFEGRHCYNSLQGCGATSSPAGCAPACSDPAPVGDPIPNGTTLPIWDYSHASGSQCSIVGGYVYRGCRMPNIRGKYFYGDYCAGSVLSFEPVGGAPTNPQSWTSQLGAGLAFGLTSFGTDAQGEIYFADRDGIVFTASPPFNEVEVSGTGAGKPLLMSKIGDWTWENLQASTWQQVTAYKVYRANVADGRFDAGEVFDCVRQSATPAWPLGGDLANPAPGGMFAYIVMAQNGAAEQTSPGGTPVRTLSALGCP